MFDRVTELFTRADKARRGRAYMDRAAFDRDVEQLLASDRTLAELEKNSWRVKDPIRRMLASGLDDDIVEVTAEGSDRNSRALLRGLVKHINSKLPTPRLEMNALNVVPRQTSKLPTATTSGAATTAHMASGVGMGTGSLSASTPTASVFTTADYFASTTSRRFHVNADTRKFIETFPRLGHLATLLVTGGTSEEWDDYEGRIFKALEHGGWRIREAVKLMRRNVRDLNSLTSGLDDNCGAVVEYLLAYVVALEQQATAAAAVSSACPSPRSPLSAPRGTNINDQYADAADGDDDLDEQMYASSPVDEAAVAASSSLTTEVTASAQSLVDSLGPTETRRIISVLHKALQNLRAHPTDAKYRSLSKTQPMLSKTIFAHLQAKQILALVGFVETPTGLSLPAVDIDKISRALRVLEQFLAV
jgi:PUB domain